MVKKEDLSTEELKKRFMILVTDLDVAILTADKTAPSTMQDIPALFEGWEKKKFQSTYKYPNLEPKEYKLDATKTIKAALWIAKKYGLVPIETPLRQVWYSFIKLALQKSGNKIGNPDQMMSIAFTDIIKDTDYYYADFNVKNYPYGFKTPDTEQAVLFPNTLIAMEKSSYYNYLINFADLLGLSIYSAGGQSALSAAESVAHDIIEKFGKQTLSMYTITDYDRAGLDIADNLKKHVGLFLERKGIIINHERVAPKPEHYSQEELERSLYDSKGKSEVRWMLPENVTERAKYNIPDTKGVEVESLPAQPLLSQLPDGMDIDKAIGQARMKLIIYDVLLEKYGIEHPLRQFLDRYFYTLPSYTADNIIKNNSNINVLDNKAWDIYYKIEELQNKFMDSLTDERAELTENIIGWRDDEKETWIDDVNRQDSFENKLRTAVAKDYQQLSFKAMVDFPDLPKDFEEWELKNVKKKQKVNDYINMLDEIIEKIDEKIDEYETEEPSEEEYN